MTGRAARLALALGMTALAPVAGHAQSAADKWQWGGAIYGWFPGISGKTSFPVPGGSPSIDVSAETLIDALKFAAMGSLEGRKGQWGFFTDLVYTNVGGSQSGTRDFTVGGNPVPAGVNANLSLDMKSWIWTITGLYSLSTKPELSADLLFGARMVNVQETLSWSFSGTVGGTSPPPGSGSSSPSVTNWDAIVGVKGRVSFGDGRKWFLPYYIDIGGGQSKLTWQGIAGVGYQFSWGSVIAVWRYLDYQMKSGVPINSINFSGPAIGVTFSW